MQLAASALCAGEGVIWVGQYRSVSFDLRCPMVFLHFAIVSLPNVDLHLALGSLRRKWLQDHCKKFEAPGNLSYLN